MGDSPSQCPSTADRSVEAQAGAVALLSLLAYLKRLTLRRSLPARYTGVTLWMAGRCLDVAGDDTDPEWLEEFETAIDRDYARYCGGVDLFGADVADRILSEALTWTPRPDIRAVEIACHSNDAEYREAARRERQARQAESLRWRADFMRAERLRRGRRCRGQRPRPSRPVARRRGAGRPRLRRANAPPADDPDPDPAAPERLRTWTAVLWRRWCES
jgi:hypothetical protein